MTRNEAKQMLAESVERAILISRTGKPRPMVVRGFIHTLCGEYGIKLTLAEELEVFDRMAEAEGDVNLLIDILLGWIANRISQRIN